MPTGAITALVQTQSSIEGGAPLSLSLTFTGTTRVTPNAVCPVAIAGELTTRTSDTEGIITSVAHGLAGTETIGVAWIDAETSADMFAYGATIDSSDDDTVTFTVTGGDVLPPASAGTTTSVVYICVAQSITSAYIPGGDSLQMYQISTTQDGYCVLLSDGGTGPGVVEVAEMISLSTPYIWPIYSGQADDFTNTIIQVDCYNRSLTASEVKLDAVLT